MNFLRVGPRIKCARLLDFLMYAMNFDYIIKHSGPMLIYGDKIKVPVIETGRLAIAPSTVAN